MNDDFFNNFFNNPTYFGKNNYSPSNIIAKLVLIGHIAKQVGDEMESAEAMALLKTIECQDHNRVINFIKANFYKYKNTVDYAIHNKQNRSDACPNGVEGCDCSSEESGRCDQILNINILKLIKDKTIEHINKYSKIYLHAMTVAIGDKLIKYNNSNFTKTLSIFSILHNDHGELKAESEAPNILVGENDIEKEFKNIIAQIDKHKNKKEKLQKMYEEFKKDCKNPLYQYAENKNIISKMQTDINRKNKGIDFLLGESNGNNNIVHIGKTYIDKSCQNHTFKSISECKNKKPGIFVYNKQEMRHM